MEKISDIYINEKNPKKSLIFPGPELIGEELHASIEDLLKQCQAVDKIDFTVKLRGYFFRGHKMKTVDGVFYALRKMPKELWELGDCGIPKPIRDYISDSRHNRGGLMIVSGMPGNGKSTTCSAIILERLLRYGGMCATVEDPVEMPLQGLHGEGFCLQKEVDPTSSFSESVRETMRAYPTGTNTIMLIGEVRDPETAALALRSSVDGRLVVFTVHAGSVVQTIHRVIALASEIIGVKEARNLLASSLRLVMNQKLVKSNDHEGADLKLSTLFDTEDVAGVIRNPKTPLESLKTAISQQRLRLNSGQKIDLRKID